MDLKWFDDLEALARTGSLSRAAQQLYVAQSALSKQMTELEGEPEDMVFALPKELRLQLVS